MIRFAQTSRRYQRDKIFISVIKYTLNLGVLAGLFYSGLSRNLSETLLYLTPYSFLNRSLFVLTIFLLPALLILPLTFYSGFTLEHRFQLSRQTISSWFKDYFKSSVLTLCLGLFVVQMIYMLLNRYPDHWWQLSTIMWIMLAIILARILPTFLLPMFYKYEEIADEGIKQRIKQLLTQCRVTFKDIRAINYSKKTKKANAMLCGLGSSRRVILTDTLIEQFNEDEIEVVVAHEIGHHKNKDIFRLLLVNMMIMGLSLYLIDKLLNWAVINYDLTGKTDIAFLPVLLIILALFGLFTAPLLNAFSCRMEIEADRYSIEKTRSPKSFINVMEKLGELNLADYQPSRIVEFLFYDHPPLYKRIQFAQRYLDE